jgi:hypothetical protein
LIVNDHTWFAPRTYALGCEDIVSKRRGSR